MKFGRHTSELKETTMPLRRTDKTSIPAVSKRVFEAMMKMVKIDVAKIEAAMRG
jgi:hypothetical protein